MEIKFVKPRSKTEWEFVIAGEETILNPIKRHLVLDSNVSFTGFRKDHPLLEGTTFVIKGKNVESSLKKAIKAFEAELKGLSKAF